MRKPATTNITTPFGQVAGYPLNNGWHSGIDFSWNPDPTVYMPEDGKLYCVPWNGKDNNGNMLVIIAGDRIHSLCHLSHFLVTEGNYREGQPIGVMGTTGFTQGRHLHWSVRKAGNLINPLSLLEENMPSTVGETEIDFMSQMAFGYPASDADKQGNKGRETNSFIRWAYSNPSRQAYLNMVRQQEQQLEDVKKLLHDAQNKPPEVLVKEVEKIVEVPIIKEVPAKEPWWASLAKIFLVKK